MIFILIFLILKQIARLGHDHLNWSSTDDIDGFLAALLIISFGVEAVLHKRAFCIKG